MMVGAAWRNPSQHQNGKIGPKEQFLLSGKTTRSQKITYSELIYGSVFTSKRCSANPGATRRIPKMAKLARKI